MNRNFALAVVLAAAAAGNAFADDITIDTTPFQSTASRAQVLSELAAFRSSGANPWADEYNQLTAFRSSRSRAQVMADFMSARQEVAALTSEDSGSSSMARNAVDTGAGMSRMALRSRDAR